MFTGLVQAVGVIEGFDGSRLSVTWPEQPSDLELGESIAVNGCCLTLAGLATAPWFQLSEETLNRTNLADSQPGDRVNIERSLLPTSRLGGHFVSGHIDAVGEIIKLSEDQGFARLEVRFPAEFRPLLVEKGSIAVDGISLTVNNPEFDHFWAAIIPHTLTHTNLGSRNPGDRVNLEFDLLAKYVRNLVKTETL